MGDTQRNQVARNAGLDVLRILAMIGIIIFHHFVWRFTNSFIQLPVGFTSDSYYYDVINNASGYIQKTSLFMDFCYAHFGYGCNFVFMLITGYFLFGKPSTFSKRASTAKTIILALAFYGLILTVLYFVILQCIWPHIDPVPITPLFTLPNWLSGDNMWYLQAYGIFILIALPLLKLFEKRLTKKMHASICVALVSIHLFNYQTYLPSLPLSNKIIFFITCYYIGGYVRTYGINLKLKQLVGLLALYIAVFICYDYYWRYSNMILFAPYEYSYAKTMLPIQPFVCAMTFAFLCFAIATKVHIEPGRNAKYILGSISSSTIGIYIFHMSVIQYSFIISNWLWWHDWTTKGFMAFMFIDTLLLFTISYVIELLRQQLTTLVRSKWNKSIPNGLPKEHAKQSSAVSDDQ